MVAKPRDAARIFLQESLNTRMSAHGVAVEFIKNTSLDVLGIRATSLIGALWLQFVMAVAEGRSFRACEVCGKSFELRPEINRKSRYYCSDACRVKAFRLRHKSPKASQSKGGK
jgi:hypothetical protein